MGNLECDQVNGNDRQVSQPAPARVKVPDIDDMTDDIFFRHLEARHVMDFPVRSNGNIAETRELTGFRHWTPYLVTLYRDFHDACHRIDVNSTSTKYNHFHKKPEIQGE